MRIVSLELQDFSAFNVGKIDLSPGLNVFIGANATGKTHAMKVLYAALRAIPKNGAALDLKQRLSEKLARVLRPDDGKIGRLVRRTRGQKSAKVRLVVEEGQLQFSVYSKDSTIRISRSDIKGVPTNLFLPSRELLAIHEGFIAAYQARELAFDETYHDAMVALSAAGLRGERPGAIKAALKDLRQMLGGKVVRHGDRFYLKGKEGELEAHLVAEGWRKLAAISHLLSNGSIVEHGLLLWDEPEANLNPLLVRRVAETLARLSDTGLQVIVATHDFLFTRTLARPDLAVRFHLFGRGDEGVTVESSDNLEELPEDPIRQAFIAHYDDVRGAASTRARG